MRIGIMGGTFNPIHNGHLLIAENAREQYKLDKVLFIPAGRPPHKLAHHVLNNEDRINMVRLAISDNPGFELSTMETDSGVISYSYLTLEALKEQNPATELFFILGADSLQKFRTWKEQARILEAATILAAVRDECETLELEHTAREIVQMYGGQIQTIRTPMFQVSSHEIRKRVCRGETIRYLVPKQGEEYILQHGLYAEGKETDE